jgi:ribonuclease J
MVEADPALVPQISGLREHDPSLLAIVLSHGHRDHWGLVPTVRPDIPMVMGKATERIMRATADFVPDAFAPIAWKHLESGKPLQIGPFAITPHLVDHSGFDAYALEIEGDGHLLKYRIYRFRTRRKDRIPSRRILAAISRKRATKPIRGN